MLAEASPRYVGHMDGDVDIATVAALVADPGRARMLLALGDGRRLPASVLAAEAGTAPSTASGHLAKLVASGLVRVERHGRHRYHRLAGPEVGALIEALAAVAPASPVRSLREGTRAEALRRARTCYDHLAGRLGTALMSALIERGLLAGGDGGFDPRGDRPSAYGMAVDYRLTERGYDRLTGFGIDVDALRGGSRSFIRYCVDWSEQRHHLSGALGAALAARVLELGWVERGAGSRALRITPDGADGLGDAFGVRLEDVPAKVSAAA